MSYLLDTHALIWTFNAPRRLSPAVRKIVESQEAVVSSASLWELLLKKDRPGTPVKEPLTWWRTYVVDRGIRILPIQWFHLLALDGLPHLHKDPFDRILISQALKEDLRLITKDSSIRQYKGIVTCIW